MGDDENSVVPKMSFRIEVKHNFEEVSIDLSANNFTEIERNYTDRNPNPHKGIKATYNLKQLLDRLNTYEGKEKHQAPAILKGQYYGGTAGRYCIKPAPYLFFDVDVKYLNGHKENAHLKDPLKNALAYEAMEKIALVIWRSNSGEGFAGILYVPQLASISKNETELHNIIGKRISGYLSLKLKEQSIKIDFDIAQNRFRQIRYLAPQSEKRFINPRPATFIYELTKEYSTFPTGQQVLTHKYFQSVPGSIAEQFNHNNTIEDVLLKCDFIEVYGINRYKHPQTSSQSSGSADIQKNIFYNHSQSFSSIKVFSPYSLMCFCFYGNDSNKFNKELKGQGLINNSPTIDDIARAKEKLKLNSASSRNETIFQVCYTLQHLPYKAKINFIKENCLDPAEQPMFFKYLKIRDHSIYYDETIFIENYVGDEFERIIDLSDKHGKIIIGADTGLGKTTAFLQFFKSIRPGKRCLILMPLTTIVDQSKYDHKDIIALTGRSNVSDHRNARSYPIVVATYEQGAKHLMSGNRFDYIVIDEAHQLLFQNSYKKDVIRDLTPYLEGCNIIGLTGTPNNIFRQIGYKLIKVEKRGQLPVTVIQIINNRSSFKIIMQHVYSIDRVKGKAIFRLNNKNVLKEIKEELISQGLYSQEEVLILSSEKHIKEGTEFHTLIHARKFNDFIKVVLTTSIIDEGINIYQEGFTDVVFIETEYNPRPEHLKQFLARFRNIDSNRKNFHYIKAKKDQAIKNWDELRDYKQHYNDLSLNTIHSKNVSDNNSTWRDLASENSYYYKDLSINVYYLAYKVTEQYFSLLNVEEFNYYLGINYNIHIFTNNEYSPLAVDTSTLKEKKEKKVATIIKLWKNNFGEVCIVISRLTNNKFLKENIEDNGEPIGNTIYNEVFKNLSIFEKLIINHLEFVTLGIMYPNSFLISGSKLTPLQTVKKQLKLLHTLQVINNPITQMDRRNREKILAFLDNVEKLKSFTAADLYKLWRKQKVSNYSSYKKGLLVDLVKLFFDLKLDKRTNIYTINFGEK